MNSKIGWIGLLAMLVSAGAYAESGTCKGTTRSGKAVKITYFTNGFTDDDIDFYAKISIGKVRPATYGLAIDKNGMSGEPTNKTRAAGLSLGPAELELSADKKAMSGHVGHEHFSRLSCTYREE